MSPLHGKKLPKLPTAVDIAAMVHASTKSDTELIEKAYTFAQNAHADQTRFSGDPYFNHVAETATYLAQLGMDSAVVAAGLLHDTIEDTNTPPEVIEQEFGADVRQLVEGVTKLGHVKYHGMVRHAESLRKLFAATSQDVRVMIIKLMDRLNNVQTLQHVPRPEKRERIALETLEIYAPIAHRLGMTKTAHDLEEAAFPYAYPNEYEKIHAVFKEAGGEDATKIERLQQDIKRKLAEYGLKGFRTESRIKSLYSFWRKLKRKENDPSKVLDIWAVRIIVQTIADCYTVLGIVHAEWTPLPGRIKDFIAFPKPNGYKAIHTTIHTGDGGILEVQIRTEDMHREAMYGIASHFSYKESSNDEATTGGGLKWLRQFFPFRLTSEGTKSTSILYTGNTAPTWVKNLASLQRESKSEIYLKEIKNDFFSERIFVFTPGGDVIDVPIGATAIDFAYAVHSEVGSHMSGAKINGKLQSIETELENGDIVEIVTSTKARPSRKWLDHAKTTMARKHIRAYLSQDHNQ
jgi:GTP pyrophosphokinase